LQGTWSVTSLEVDGQNMAGMLDGARVVVKGDRFTSTGMGAEYQGVVSLDETKKPQCLDMKFDTGPEKGNTNLGIYKLEGDTCTPGSATRGRVRPSKFISMPASGIALETLKRGKVAMAARARATNKPLSKSIPNAAATPWEGAWTMVSGIFNGQP